MFELMLLAQINIQPQIIDGVYNPGRVNVRVGNTESAWLTHTRTPGDCRQYSSEQGYNRYVWSPELQPTNTGIYLTGSCNGIKQKQQYRIEALEQEINEGER